MKFLSSVIFFGIIIVNNSLLATSTSVSTGDILSTPYYSIGVHLYPNGLPNTNNIYIDTFSFAGAESNTTNLPLSLKANSTIGGSTLVVLNNNNEVIVPLCILPACTFATTSTSITITNLSLTSSSEGLVATETWTFLIVNQSSFQWNVQRTYSSSSITMNNLLVNRFGLTLQTTGGLPIYAQQIPSYMDMNMFYDTTTTGGFNIYNSAYEYLSPTAYQYVRMSPTGALFTFAGEYSNNNNNNSDVFWSFAKPFADGTTWSNIGFEFIDPRINSNPMDNKPMNINTNTDIKNTLTTEQFSMTVTLLASDVPAPSNVYDPFPSLDIDFNNKTLQNQILTLMGSQYQLNGWIMGNNPSSVPCLHEMAWWPLMSSLYPANSIVFEAMKKELSFFSTCGWAPSP